MNFLNPGILGNIQYFRRNYTNPIEKYQDAEVIAKLRKKVYPFILRRKKEEVAKDLPPKEVITVYIDMTDKQRELYETYRKLFIGQIEETLLEQTPAQASMFILAQIFRLRQICIFPELFKKEYAHVGSGKFDYLKDVIDEILFEKHKVICFSQFVQALTIMRNHFDAKKIRYSYIDGQTQNRQEQIDEFQYNAKIPLFLISLKAGGLGVNLTAADYVILFDPWWNPAVENQAIDRAHRIGRKNKVIAYRLIMKNSIEEKIELLQNKKRRLASDLITDDTSFLKSLTKADIIELFS
jgi:non-specific serine/threonine protein kinase